MKIISDPVTRAVFARYDPAMRPALVTLAIMLVGSGALACGTAVALMAWSLIHPPRMTDGKAMYLLRRLSPADLGLTFEEVRLEVRDERGRPMPVAGWWVPHPDAGGRCAVIIHGYADAKVGAIAWAPVWHSLEFNLFVPDLRAHGESGGSTATAGFYERHDLSQAVSELRAQKPRDTRQLVLCGLSMGAAVAAATAMELSDLSAVVLDSPYADFRHAAVAHMDRLGLPGKWLQSPAIRLAEWLTRANYDAVRPVSLLPAIRCPVFLIEAACDSYLSTSDRAGLSNAMRSRAKSFPQDMTWTLAGVEHLMCFTADPAEYRRRLHSFLEGAMKIPDAGPAGPAVGSDKAWNSGPAEPATSDQP